MVWLREQLTQQLIKGLRPFEKTGTSLKSRKALTRTSHKHPAASAYGIASRGLLLLGDLNVRDPDLGQGFSAFRDLTLVPVFQKGEAL